MNTGVHVSFWISFIQIHAQKWTARSYGNSIFSFLKNVHNMFSTVAAPIYIPTNVEGFPFLQTLSSIMLLPL